MEEEDAAAAVPPAPAPPAGPEPEPEPEPAPGRPPPLPSREGRRRTGSLSLVSDTAGSTTQPEQPEDEEMTPRTVRAPPLTCVWVVHDVAVSCRVPTVVYRSRDGLSKRRSAVSSSRWYRLLLSFSMVSKEEST